MYLLLPVPMNASTMTSVSSISLSSIEWASFFFAILAFICDSKIMLHFAPQDVRCFDASIPSAPLFPEPIKKIMFEFFISLICCFTILARINPARSIKFFW